MLIFKIIPHLPHLPQYFQHLLMVLMKHKILFGLVFWLFFFFFYQNCQRVDLSLQIWGFGRITSVKYSQVVGDEKAEEAAAGL